MTAYVYILRDLQNRYYLGSTTNLQRRLRQHQSGHTQTTRNMKSPGLVLCQEYPTLSEARRIERRIKKLKRKDYIQKIVEDGVIKMK